MIAAAGYDAGRRDNLSNQAKKILMSKVNAVLIRSDPTTY
jgi:hypothetical protein